jgi:penicillin amidase
LYQEKTDHTRPGAFLFDGSWEQERTLDEVIQVRGAEPIRTTIRFSRNGPIVNAILPGAARQSEPVSLKWLGAYGGGWLTALLAMNRARSADDFREATRSWIVPTWNLVFADLDGHIGYQMTGRIPVRGVNERGYRPGWLRAHQWEGVIPFDAMPHSLDPESGWAITANHRPAPDDFPYPLAGTWTDDLRARRVRELIEGNSLLSRDDFVVMHQDSLSLRAVRLVPQLLDVLTAENDERVRVAVRELRVWDCRYEPDRVGASIFEVFFNHWIEEVARARFEGEVAALMLNGISGLAATLLSDDPTGWFAAGVREDSIRQCFHTALDYLTNRLGPEIASWTWSKLHTLPLRHVLSTRGELNQLLDHGGLPCPGTGTTVCNTWPNPDYTARSGAGYRMIADLSSSPPVLWAVDAQSQSGHPGSPHYGDQLTEWLAGSYHEIPLDRQKASESTVISRVLHR